MLRYEFDQFVPELGGQLARISSRSLASSAHRAPTRTSRAPQRRAAARGALALRPRSGGPPPARFPRPTRFGRIAATSAWTSAEAARVPP